MDVEQLSREHLIRELKKNRANDEVYDEAITEIFGYINREESCLYKMQNIENTCIRTRKYVRKLEKLYRSLV